MSSKFYKDVTIALQQVSGVEEVVSSVVTEERASNAEDEQLVSTTVELTGFYSSWITYWDLMNLYNCPIFSDVYSIRFNYF